MRPLPVVSGLIFPCSSIVGVRLIAFPTRTALPSRAAEQWISRFPSRKVRYARGVCDRAGSDEASR